MLRFLKSWRAARWLVFLVALIADGYVFYLADPWTPESFQASGLIALALFFIFFELALLMRGDGRIRGALNDRQRIAYQVGRHLIGLLRKIKASPLARRAIWIPVWIALLTTTFWAGWVAWRIAEMMQHHIAWLAPLYTAVNNKYVCAGYIPLLVAIPFVLEHVSEWRSHQYVLVVTEARREPQLHIYHGVLSIDHKIVLLESTVTIHLHQRLAERMIGVGDVELTEKAGGEGEKLECVWRPGRLAKQISGTR